MSLLAHAGGAGSYHAFVGFDMKQHRAVIVLSTSSDLSVEAVGFTLLQEFPLTPDSCKTYACELVGIGVALDIDKTSGNLRITKVFPQSPAAQAGLTSGSAIQKIGDTPVQGIPLKNSLDLLRGSAGTQVHLDLLDPAGKPLAVDITRRKLLLPPAT
jgi:C-terminal processing protease CtpA/Prc